MISDVQVYGIVHVLDEDHCPLGKRRPILPLLRPGAGIATRTRRCIFGQHGMPPLLAMQGQEWVPQGSIASGRQREAFLGRDAGVPRDGSSQAILRNDCRAHDVNGGGVGFAPIVRLIFDVSNLDPASVHSHLSWTGVVGSPLDVAVCRDQQVSRGTRQPVFPAFTSLLVRAGIGRRCDLDHYKLCADHADRGLALGRRATWTMPAKVAHADGCGPRRRRFDGIGRRSLRRWLTPASADRERKQ